MEHSDDEEEETVESFKAKLATLQAKYRKLDDRLAESELWRGDIEDKMETLRRGARRRLGACSRPPGLRTSTRPLSLRVCSQNNSGIII